MDRDIEASGGVFCERKEMQELVKLERVTKEFEKRRIIEDVTCEIKKGEIWWIRGASGAGKTTFLRMLMGLEEVSSGKVGRKKGLKFSAVFQENRLLEWCDAVENVEFVASDLIDRERVIENLQKVLPRECLFQPVSTLSGGMKRRVALVRAVIVDSDILVLDEPFTGLDEKAMKKVEEYILEERRGRAIVIASHQGEEEIFSDIAYQVLELRG